MKTCVIFCAGGFDKLAQPVGNEDLVIAADGGYLHTQRLGLEPDIVLGDFDSLGFVPEGANVYPVEKDDTDSMLAARRGLAAGCTDFVIYGGLDGPRLDHTLANVQTLLFLAERGARGTLVGLKHTITTVKNEKIIFPADHQGTVSVLCMGKAATGVTIQGMKYSLEDGTLSADYPLGVSNSFVGKESSVCVKEGCVLVLLDTASGMRWRYG